LAPWYCVLVVLYGCPWGCRCRAILHGRCGGAAVMRPRQARASHGERAIWATLGVGGVGRRASGRELEQRGSSAMGGARRRWWAAALPWGQRRSARSRRRSRSIHFVRVRFVQACTCERNKERAGVNESENFV
jgi:hypothetical protein